MRPKQHAVRHRIAIGEGYLDGPFPVADANGGVNDIAVLGLAIRASNRAAVYDLRRAPDLDLVVVIDWVNAKAYTRRIDGPKRLDRKRMQRGGLRASIDFRFQRR